MNAYQIKQSKKIILMTILIIFTIINGFGIAIGATFYNQICKAEIDRNFDNYNYFKSTFDANRLSTLDTEDVNIKSVLGYNLSGTFIKNPITTDKTVIIVHGFKGSRWESMKYADMYIDKGFNVLVYDSRYHGMSGGTDITMGYFEKYDLESCVKWVKKFYPDGIIGVHGESLGAATALLHSKMNEKKKEVSFYVSDCAYSDLSGLLNYLVKSNIQIYHPIIGKILTFYCSIVVFAKSGFSLYSVSPIKAIKNVQTPIMFIHGANDSFIPAYMSVNMYNIKIGYKQLYIAPSSDHAQAYLNNIDEYRKKVYNFIDNIK